MTARISEEAAANATSAAAVIPAQFFGRHSRAKNSAVSTYQGAPTALSAISIGASGSSIRAAPANARSQGDLIQPSRAW
jgi:hypothetical protein